MSPQLKNPFLLESSQLIGQIGNVFVLNLYARLREMQTLTRSIALTMEQLPASDELVLQMIPNTLDFHGDRLIAGGGIWFEPYQFHPEQERCSFFWGRDPSGQLVYCDGYNQSESGYHQEEWYIVGQYAQKGQCLWSKSYMDPHSQELIITCTTPIFKAAQFVGVVTVDVTLNGLQDKINHWQKKMGGYIFILDRNNQFITFPDFEQVKKSYISPAGDSLEKIVCIDELAKDVPAFSPLLAMVKEMDAVVLDHSLEQDLANVNIAQAISHRSEHMGYEEGQMFAAILSDPLNSGDRTDYLFQQYELEQDGLLQEPAIAFLFHVPKVYWKVFMVRPRSEVHATTHNLIQADKMATLGQMLVGVAHELNNPLNFLVGNLNHARNYMFDLLRVVNLYQDSYPSPTLVIKQAIEQIDLEFLQQDLPNLFKSMKIGADRTLEIIKALKGFSRLDEEDYQRADLHEGLNNTLLLLNNRLQLKNSRYSIKVIQDYGDLPSIECLPGQLNQVFMNLLVNAMDALEETCAIHEKVYPSSEFSPTLQVGTTRLDSDHIRVCIQDNGAGIPLEVQERLFTPFFTTKVPGKGTGLGLTICRQIINERHGGRLHFQSTPSVGTTFMVDLPVQAEPNAPA